MTGKIKGGKKSEVSEVFITNLRGNMGDGKTAFLKLFYKLKNISFLSSLKGEF